MAILKKVSIIVCLILISGCIDTGERIWDNGFLMSKEKNQAFVDCQQEIRLKDPDLFKLITAPNASVEVNIRFFHALNQCLSTKGY